MKIFLVTGVGSLLGQGIIKTILSSKKKFKIIGTDYFKDAIGFNWVNNSYLLPDILKKKNIKSWEKKILRIIKNEKISYLIPGLDFELERIIKIKKKIEEKTSCKVIISNEKIIKTFQDKWLTYKFLQKNNFLYPKTTLPNNLKNFLKENKFPLIVKPRKGHTSKNVFLVKNKFELKIAIKKSKNPIIQEYLFKKNNEYTCGSIFSNNKVISVITLNRSLKNGNTIKAIHLKNKNFVKINNYIKNITNFIKPFGPLNFQLCLTSRGPMIFEVNPRFSGTTPLRFMYGVNEIDILIDDLEKKRQKKIKYKYGTVMRYFENLFLK